MSDSGALGALKYKLTLQALKMQKKIDVLQTIPRFGFARLTTILGNPKAKPPVPAIIPISKSSWWEGINKGIYPKPIKLSERTTAWRWEDIHALVTQLGAKS